MQDDEFHFDKIIRNIISDKIDETCFECLEKNITSVSAFFIGWPYIVYQRLGNFLIIVNTFNEKTLHRV